MKSLYYTCFALSLAACVLWPIMAMMSVFAFDAPIQGASDALKRAIIAAWLISYPAGLFVAMVRARRLRKNQVEWRDGRACALISLPFIQLGAFIAWIFLS